MKNMKSALIGVVAAVAMSPLAFSTAAFAQAAPYVSLGGGFSMPNDSTVDYRNTPTSPKVTGTTGFDTGYIFSGALGYRFESGLRTEAEINFRKSGVDSIAGTDASGKQRVLGLMGNVLYDFAPISTFRPYIGGGVGVGWNKWSGVSAGPSATFPAGTATVSDKDTAFQWQGIAGVATPISERTDVFVEYRYIGLEQNKFAGVTGTTMASRHDDRSHNALVGVRYNF